jgi:arylsulfatase A-like enzyme
LELPKRQPNGSCIVGIEMMKTITAILIATGVLANAHASTYPVVDTGQTTAYGDVAGQDADYSINPPAYRDNGDGTISDLVTGLMWTQDPGEKMTYAQAVDNADEVSVGGYDDWRLPTIKELYSLIDFSGVDPGPRSSRGDLKPFIDNEVFEFQYGDTSQGERLIDSQFATSTIYVSTTMGGAKTMFGVNFADGRIKGYPVRSPRGEKTFHVLYVRSNPGYGTNRFRDNGDGTVSDEATGLTWMKADSGKGMDWPSALEYAESMKFAGHSDWRLPTAKELHSIVDYTRSPDTTDSAAIDPVFESTGIVNEGGAQDFAHYWTSTSHVGARGASTAVYINFGRSLGWMENRRTGNKTLMDVHGAGAQRSDPKTGDASRYPYGRGPQGDVIRIDNLVRLVRGDGTATATSTDTVDKPNIIFIYADDMGWTGTSVEMLAGDPASRSDFYETPNLETLASRGMVFSQAYSPGPLCTPSRAAVLTGRTPAELHVTTPGGGRTDGSRALLTPRPSTQLPEDTPTIGTILKAEGYATALLGKWHIGRRDHAGHYGFDEHDGATGNEGSGTAADPKEIFSLTERGIRFMEKSVAAGEPFYLQLSHYAVHGPAQGRPASIDRFSDMAPGSIHQDPGFAGMAWDLDASLAQIFDALEALDIKDETYVVFMSDNGATGNRRRPDNTPLFAGKGSLFEGGIRVPLIVSGPGITAGYSSTAVSGVDLFATFAAWAGADVESSDSEDLTPLLHGMPEQFTREHALLFHYPHYGQGRFQTPQTALVLDRWKLLRNWEAGTYALYDLASDLGETNDLSAENPDVFNSMLEAMNARLQDLDAQLPSANPDYDGSAEPQRRRRQR